MSVRGRDVDAASKTPEEAPVSEDSREERPDELLAERPETASLSEQAHGSIQPMESKASEAEVNAVPHH